MSDLPVDGEALRVRTNLCESNYGNGDTYPNPNFDPDYKVLDNLPDAPADRMRAIRDAAPATYFTCASKANGIFTFPCTGSAHRYGHLIVCDCSCHSVDEIEVSA